MTYKVIKVSEDNYKWLLRESSAIAYESGKKATFNDALSSLIERRSKKKKLTQAEEILKFAGAWSDMSKEEEKKIMDAIYKNRKNARSRYDLS